MKNAGDKANLAGKKYISLNRLKPIKYGHAYLNGKEVPLVCSVHLLVFLLLRTVCKPDFFT